MDTAHVRVGHAPLTLPVKEPGVQRPPIRTTRRVDCRPHQVKPEGSLSSSLLPEAGGRASCPRMRSAVGPVRETA